MNETSFVVRVMSSTSQSINLESPKCSTWTRYFFKTVGPYRMRGPLQKIRIYDLERYFLKGNKMLKNPLTKVCLV